MKVAINDFGWTVKAKMIILGALFIFQAKVANASITLDRLFEYTWFESAFHIMQWALLIFLCIFSLLTFVFAISLIFFRKDIEKEKFIRGKALVAAISSVILSFIYAFTTFLAPMISN
ncbi:hypothetical protein HN784_04055 [bacterium]|jgi:hypothetical protein|nr:hypothetical protein [bacterium]MBT4251165.1 hypothetical protein [bacterium]MBT4598043.1 hypothetical protein [bacterium]MBT6753545.1 hypothetical protein [bacterium]MBT7037660.1 hypothetical protein [bacterium]